MSEHHPMSEALSYSPDPFIADVAAELDRLHAIERAAQKCRETSGYVTTDLAWQEVDANDWAELVALLAANKNHSPKGTK